MNDIFGSRPPAATIATLTLNPTVDTAFQAEEVQHTHKTRTFDEQVDPGGGGINVARVLKRFGADATAIFLAGGYTGRLLDELLGRECLERVRLEIEGHTRLSVTIFERSTGREYRFVPEGPEVSEAEWEQCLEVIGSLQADYVVASGSLPPGAPDDFYAQVHTGLPSNTRFVLDTSGSELRRTLCGGGVFLVKPSRSELEEFVERELRDQDDVAAAASEIVAAGLAEHVAVTLGRDGALLANATGTECFPAPKVQSRSAVGAGDSFLAGMIYAFASGADPSTALRLGVASGAASTLNPGTDLCDQDDVARLFQELGADC